MFQKKNWEKLKYYPRVRKAFLSTEQSSEAIRGTTDTFNNFLKNPHGKNKTKLQKI